jgi:hypothetical protein
MYRFWETIIEPALEILKPGVIVEIGCFRGFNTRKIVEFCARRGGVLHAVDPEPELDVKEWQGKYGKTLVFHKTASLQALSEIEKFDVVLIDGDHNWYTVYNELKTIDHRCRQSGRPFSLIMLHDTGWPYGRRDMYYNPETIPPDYRKPYQKKGLYPGSTELLEQGGINKNLFNAVSENCPQNGVLTAIEDFMSESETELELLNIIGFNGLGILYPAAIKKQRTDLWRFLVGLFISPAMARYMEKIEIDRIIMANCCYERTLEAAEIKKEIALGRVSLKVKNP